MVIRSAASENTASGSQLTVNTTATPATYERLYFSCCLCPSDELVWARRVRRRGDERWRAEGGRAMSGEHWEKRERTEELAYDRQRRKGADLAAESLYKRPVKLKKK